MSCVRLVLTAVPVARIAVSRGNLVVEKTRKKCKAGPNKSCVAAAEQRAGWSAVLTIATSDAATARPATQWLLQNKGLPYFAERSPVRIIPNLRKFKFPVVALIGIVVTKARKLHPALHREIILVP